MDQTFNLVQVVEIAKALALDLDAKRLREWQTAGYLAGDADSTSERVYSFDELTYIVSLAFFADRVRLVSESLALAQSLAYAIKEVYASGPDGDVVDAAPIYLLLADRGGNILEQVDKERKLKSVALYFGHQAPVVVAPGFLALDLSARVEDCLKKRN